jgi:hypothetical protein
MSKVIMFSDLFLPTFPFIDLPLYNELKNLEIKVDYILQENDIRLMLPELFPVYIPITTTIKKPKHINALLNKDDLLVMRFCYRGVAGDLANHIRSQNKNILMLDPAAIDIGWRECPAQYITSKSPWMTEQVKKKFPNKYKEVFTTGTIHFDDAWKVEVNKQELMKSYGLNPNKKLAILCKASQGEIGHQKGVDDEYKQIVEIVKNKCQEYELLFKCHPIDHLSQYPVMPGVQHKNEHYNNKPSWETLFPKGINILKPEEGYKAFKCADVILNVRSSVGMESMLFPTPIININSHKYLTNWPKVNDDGIMKNIEMKELEKTLNNNGYNIDREKCIAHVKRYCDPEADGKSYIRTAQVIKKLIGG